MNEGKVSIVTPVSTPKQTMVTKTIPVSTPKQTMVTKTIPVSTPKQTMVTKTIPVSTPKQTMRKYMLGARLLPMQPTQHSKPPAIRVGGAPTRPSMGPVNSPVDTQGKQSPFLVFVVFHIENIQFQRYQNTGIYYDLRQPTDHALFTHLHHAMLPTCTKPRTMCCLPTCTKPRTMCCLPTCTK